MVIFSLTKKMSKISSSLWLALFGFWCARLLLSCLFFFLRSKQGSDIGLIFGRGFMRMGSTFTRAMSYFIVGQWYFGWITFFFMARSTCGYLKAKNSATIFSGTILTFHQYWTNHAPQTLACSQCFLLHFSFYTDRSLNCILDRNFLGHRDSCRNNVTRSQPICLIESSHHRQFQVHCQT